MAPFVGPSPHMFLVENPCAFPREEFFKGIKQWILNHISTYQIHHYSKRNHLGFTTNTIVLLNSNFNKPMVGYEP